MGCDIHFVIERRRANWGSGGWIGIYSSDCAIGGRPKIGQRDYDFFAEVAGVRGSTDTTVWPRNVPEDISPLAWSQYMRCPTDHHSASHMNPSEFIAAYRRANPIEDASRASFDTYDLLGIDSFDDEKHEYRVVFWFDN